MKLIYKIENTIDINISVNEILQNRLKISNRLRQELIKNKAIFCNCSICDTRDFTKFGDIISISFDSQEDNSNIVPNQMNLDIIYEDEWMLVINKPSGIAIHPSILHYDNSLSNGIRFYFDTIGLHKKIRPVNRLDYGTSGIVIFAKCGYIHECLSLQMQNNEFKKKYLALVHGKLTKDFGTIDLPIARKENSIVERCINTKTR